MLIIIRVSTADTTLTGVTPVPLLTTRSFSSSNMDMLLLFMTAFFV